MKVGMTQSDYVPWRGYFDFIDDVDLFVFYDDVQYGQGRKWRNRNRIKTPHGVRWITVPLKHKRTGKLINEVEIDYSRNWQRDHLNKLKASYGTLPHFETYVGEFAETIGRPYPSISDLDFALAKWVMEKLDIRTETRMSHEFRASGDKWNRPVNILLQLGATAYLSGPTAESYTDEELFRSHGIRLEYKSYEYAPYPQPWGEFVSEVTILDLLFCMGPEAGKYLKSVAPNRIAVP